MNLLTERHFFFGFRPEHFLPEGVAADEDNRVPFTFHVNRIEYLGSERYLYGHIRGHEETKVIAMLPATVTLPVVEDQDHRFSVAANQIRYFDRDDGMRIPPQPLAL
jgi:multiple sugar transport system ATP-binding protein